MSESSRELLFAQLSDVAPAVSKLLRTYTSRIRAHVTTGDVINTYGITMVFQVFIDVWTARCKGCGETQFTPPNFGDCPNHRFIKEWSEVASGESKDGLEAALKQTENSAAKWLKCRGITL